MPTRILVIADTHVSALDQLPWQISDLVRRADIVVHCGDYTYPAVVAEIQRLSKRFMGVYGNSDVPEVKEMLPKVATFEIGRTKIVVTHPFDGGPPWGLEDELVKSHAGVDVILFGHTHDTHLAARDGVLLLNPGQGYPTFFSPATVGVLTVTEEGARGWVGSVNDARVG